MRVLIMTDLEGVAGVSTPTVDTSLTGDNYRNCKRLLAEEVNAAARGFLKAGASEIIVFDGHGPGAVDFETLKPPAKLIHGRPLPPVVWLMKKLFARVDVTCSVGQHAMAGVRDGNLNHTQNSKEIMYYKLNGQLIGETAQFALLAGEYNIPYIFLSGDHAACREAEELIPGITTASVKEGLGRTSALSLSAEEARALIEEQTEKALLNHLAKPIPPLRWEAPYTLEKCYLHSEVADMSLGNKRITRLDNNTVVLKGDTIAEIIYS